ncbi:MAG: hypothetical protein VKO64_01615 [Candidatus Sericytochromatia bacterium]|nr:hypothetical protein [Candidatus Sericytochromatia bacterium]
MRLSGRPPRGFNLLEAMLAGVILAGGTVALAQMTRVVFRQVEALERDEGHATIVERLVMQQIQAILTRTPLEDGRRFPVIPPLVEPSGLVYEVRVSPAAQAGCQADPSLPGGNFRCNAVTVFVVLRQPDSVTGTYPDLSRLYRLGEGVHVTPRVTVWPRKGYPWLRPLQ